MHTGTQQKCSLVWSSHHLANKLLSTDGIKTHTLLSLLVRKIIEEKSLSEFELFRMTGQVLEVGLIDEQNQMYLMVCIMQPRLQK